MKEYEEAFREFWALPKDLRLNIFEGSFSDIGGRSTELDQLAFSVYHAVKERYPINGVPPEMVAALAEFEHQCSQALKAFAEILRILIAEEKKGKVS